MPFAKSFSTATPLITTYFPIWNYHRHPTVISKKAGSWRKLPVTGRRHWSATGNRADLCQDGFVSVATRRCRFPLICSLFISGYISVRSATRCCSSPNDRLECSARCGAAEYCYLGPGCECDQGPKARCFRLGSRNPHTTLNLAWDCFPFLPTRPLPAPSGCPSVHFVLPCSADVVSCPEAQH